VPAGILKAWTLVPTSWVEEYTDLLPDGRGSWEQTTSPGLMFARSRGASVTSGRPYSIRSNRLDGAFGQFSGGARWRAVLADGLGAAMGAQPVPVSWSLSRSTGWRVRMSTSTPRQRTGTLALGHPCAHDLEA
jgi:hypothetical protein